MLEIRRYRVEDKPRCVELLQQGHDSKFTQARFDWLHHKNIQAPSDIALAVDGKEVAGFYAALKKTAIIDGKRYVLARDIDPVVNPSHRGQGIFTRLLDFALENFTDIDFFYNFANQASSPGFIKRGWKRIGPLRDNICQTGFDRYFSREFVVYAGSFARCLRKHNSKISEISIDDLEKYTNLIPVQPEAKIWVERSIPYLQWRYKQNPMHHYRIFEYSEGSLVKSLCFTRYIAEKRHLLILDLVPFEGSQYILTHYLTPFKKEFQQVAIYLWHAIPKSMLHCFVTNPTNKNIGQNFLVRKFPGKDVPDSIFDLNNWYVTRGDSEVF